MGEEMACKRVSLANYQTSCKDLISRGSAPYLQKGSDCSETCGTVSERLIFSFAVQLSINLA